MIDLIDLDKARQNIPSSQNTDEPVISTLITAASRAIRRFCRRDFTQTTYDELYSGTGDRRLYLRQFPLMSVQSCRYRPVTVFKIINSLANTPQARVAVTNVGLTLTRVTNGVTFTDTSVTYAANTTILSVLNAINALGNGWQALSTGYDNWPFADIYCPNGISGTDSANPQAQGALTAAGQNAEIKMHTYELAGFQVDQRRGWLLRAIPYTDPELLHPEDLVWPVGINNLRVQYTAGFAIVPEDVQEACAELVATYFAQRGRDLSLQAEALGSGHSYSAQNPVIDSIPERVAALLRPYRITRMLANQS
jgi:hypothetical protein